MDIPPTINRAVKHSLRSTSHLVSPSARCRRTLRLGQLEHVERIPIRRRVDIRAQEPPDVRKRADTGRDRDVLFVADTVGDRIAQGRSPEAGLPPQLPRLPIERLEI